MKKVIIIGAAKPGYSEAITRTMIKEGIFVIGTFEKEYVDNSKLLTTEFTKQELLMQNIFATTSTANSAKRKVRKYLSGIRM